MNSQLSDPVAKEGPVHKLIRELDEADDEAELVEIK